MKYGKKYIILLFPLLISSFSPVFSQVIVLNPQEGSITKLHHIAVTIAGKPGATSTLFVNSDSVSSGKIRIDGQYDFLNIEVPDGPVELMVQAAGALNRIYSMKRNIHVLGVPEKIIPSESEIEITADGSSQKTVHFEIQDKWGYKLAYLKFATIRINKGNIKEPDLNPDIPGKQIAVNDGLLDISLVAPSEPSRAILEIEVNGLFTQIPVRFIPPVEPFIMVGSFKGSLGNYPDLTGNQDHPDRNDMVDENNQANPGLNYSSRSAFYAKGGVGKDMRLTAAYDSDRDYYDQVFEDIDPNEQYPLYGDASTIIYDAQTKSKYYAKLERDESFLLLGDYNTNFEATEFTAYNRTFNGLLSNIENQKHKLSSFATLTNRALIRDEIRGEGISGYYYSSKGNILRFSEKVRIETRDRYHPEQVLKSNKLIRYHDYDINYVDGTLMFKQPVSSIDANGNPIFIVVYYEYETNIPETKIGGLRYTNRVNDKLQVGSTLIFEEQSKSNYLLSGIDVNLPLYKWLAIKGEYAESFTPDDDEQDRDHIGKAFKTELIVNVLSDIIVNGYYRKVDDNFVNNSQSGNEREAGSEKYGGKGTWTQGNHGISTEYYRQFNKVGSLNENRTRALKLNYNYKLNKLGQIQFGYEDAARERKNSASSRFEESRSELLYGELSYKLTSKISGTLEHNHNLNRQDRSKPNSTLAGISYELTEAVNVFYKYRLTTGKDSKTHSIFGFESKVNDNTQMSGKYEIGGGINDKRNRASIGLRNKWMVTDELTFNLSYENTSTIDSLEIPTPDHQALSIAFEYLPDVPWKTTGKFESRADKISVKNVYSLGTDLKIWNGLSSILKLNYLITEYDNSNSFDKHANYQLGLAYRPELFDYFNCLLKGGLITEENTHVNPDISSKRMIFSLHSYWQPVARLEFGGRIATRQILDEEGSLYSDLVITDLYSLRTEFELSLKWSTALDLRYIYLRPTEESKKGVSFEINYLLVKNMQVGLGYVFYGYDDPDFGYLEYNISRFYLSLHLKFSEEIFNWR